MMKTPEQIQDEIRRVDKSLTGLVKQVDRGEIGVNAAAKLIRKQRAYRSGLQFTLGVEG